MSYDYLNTVTVRIWRYDNYHLSSVKAVEGCKFLLKKLLKLQSLTKTSNKKLSDYVQA